MIRVWRTNWASLYRKLLEGGWKLPDVRAVTVGQWFGVLQKDGPGSEQAVEYAGVDDPRFIAARNVKRAKLGLPLLPVPGEEPKGDAVAKDAELKQGQRVSTPHGVGTVKDRDAKGGGWVVDVVGIGPVFYPAHELYVLPDVPAQQQQG